MQAFISIIRNVYLTPPPILDIDTDSQIDEETATTMPTLVNAAKIRKQIPDTVGQLVHLMIEMYYVSITTMHFFYSFTHTKHRYMKAMCNNSFITYEIVDKFYISMSRVQRAYFGFERLARVWKYKHSIVQISHDLYMNEINPNDKKTLVLLQNGKLYYFSVSDLSKIIKNSITHAASYLFPEPLPIKNPFTNIIFTKSDLYNIYFKLRDSYCVIPYLIELFFRYNFDIFYLRKWHEKELLKHIIDTYIRDAPLSHLYDECLDMLYQYGFDRNICPDNRFPREQFIQTMRPFLNLHLNIKCNPDKLVVMNLNYEIKYRLKAFVTKYPLYGQAIHEIPLRFAHTPMIKNKFFDKEDISHFMISHVNVETYYNSYIRRGRYLETFPSIPTQLTQPIIFPENTNVSNNIIIHNQNSNSVESIVEHELINEDIISITNNVVEEEDSDVSHHESDDEQYTSDDTSDGGMTNNSAYDIEEDYDW